MRNTFVRVIVLGGGLLALLTASSASDPPSPGPTAPGPITIPTPKPPAIGKGEPSPPTQPAAPSPVVPAHRLETAGPGASPDAPAGAPRQPANVNQLKADIEALRAERKNAAPSLGADSGTDRERLRSKVNELLKRLDAQVSPSDPRIGPPVAPPPSVPKAGSTEATPPIDSLQAAINRFRGSDLEGAQQVLQRLDLTKLNREDRAYAQYLLGCCHRRANRLTEAATVFRAVANDRDDDFVAEAAISQLALIKTAQEMEALLEQLRARQKQR